MRSIKPPSKPGGGGGPPIGIGGGGGGELEEGVDEVLDTVSGGVFEVFFEVSAGWVE